MSSIRSMKFGALFAMWAATTGCAGVRNGVTGTDSATSERELAMRKLQAPLETHLCQTAVYPIAKQDWPLQRVQAFTGRGKTFEAALEALCREVEGRRLPAVVDIYYTRTPSGWSPNFEIRGTAVRFDEGFSPPPPPQWSNIRPPEMPANLDVEPPPAGEGVKTSAWHYRGWAGLIKAIAIKVIG